jgi:hypothetical protein
MKIVVKYCTILYSIKKYVMPVGNWARYSTLQVAGKGELLLLITETASQGWSI